MYINENRSVRFVSDLSSVERKVCLKSEYAVCQLRRTESVSKKRLDFARFYESLLTDKLSIQYKRHNRYVFKK